MNKHLLLLILVIVANGCINEPENSGIPENELGQVKLDEGLLKFKTVLDYERALEAKDPVQDFYSMASLLSDSGVPDSERYRVLEENGVLADFQDSYLLQLLDSNGMIMIDEYLIKLDFSSEMAYVTEDLEKRQDLAEGEYSGSNIEAYSFDDDLLEILFGPEVDVDLDAKDGVESARVLSCPGSYPPGSTFPPMIYNPSCDSRKCEWVSIYQEGVWEYRAEAMHAYQAAAIYFRLKSELAHSKRNTSTSGGWSSEGDPNMNIVYWGNFTPKNRSTVTLSGCYSGCQGCSPPPANTEKVQKVHHEAGRRLTSYNLYGIFDVHLGGNHAASGYPDVFQLINIQE